MRWAELLISSAWLPSPTVIPRLDQHVQRNTAAIMAPPPDLSLALSTPFSTCKITQLRTSKMQKMRNLSIETGIYKTPRAGRLWCSSTGLADDEHDLTFHGGVDKAVHQYYPGHYERWREEFPNGSGFELGGFGENIVADGGMNEWNVCIGDVYRIGRKEDGAVLQVSLPRQPCFKLNHRFEMKGFAPNTWKMSRTGWYYRVLNEGCVFAYSSQYEFLDMKFCC